MHMVLSSLLIPLKYAPMITSAALFYSSAKPVIIGAYFSGTAGGTRTRKPEGKGF